MNRLALPWRLIRVSGALLLGLLVSPAWAGDEQPTGDLPGPVPTGEAAPPVAEPDAEPAVAVIRGSRVNVRVGPRVDVRPVTRLDDGAVVLIVERVPGWFGVRIPEGFPAAVSARYVQFVGEDAVRIHARRLNMRAHPPVEGRPMPGAFRDHPEFGAVLPLIERDGDWVWVLAPETTRAYVSADFVHELGVPDTAAVATGRVDHSALLAAARARRADKVKRLAAERQERAAELSGQRLREAIGTAQQALYRLRIEEGMERLPVVRVINALEAAMEVAGRSPRSVRKIAYVLRQDLEGELEIRMARKDAEVARLRGLEPKPERTPAPRARSVVVRGGIRWEAAPTWRNGGAYVLWSGGEPKHVLRLTTGLPHPVPDLAKHAGKGLRTIEGSQPGERVFGLPVIEVRSIKE